MGDTDRLPQNPRVSRQSDGGAADRNPPFHRLRSLCFFMGRPRSPWEDGACRGLCVGELVDEVVAGHLGGLGEAHDVEEGGGDVGEFSVFNFGVFVGGDVDAGDGVEGVGGVG